MKDKLKNPVLRCLRRRRLQQLTFTVAASVVMFMVASYIPALVLLDIKGYVMYYFGVQTDMMIYANDGYHVMHYDTPRINYLINNPGKCLQNDPFIVIFVKTHPEHFSKRQVIRKTWGDVTSWTKLQKDTQPLILFILGLANKHSHSLQESLVNENDMYHDMIQESFVEGFHNLTVKLVSQFKWPVLYCQNAKFWMTTDDDVFVNIQNLITYLSALKMSSVFVGQVHAGSPSNKDISSKYYVPESVYRGSYYPPYCPGAGYVLSMNIIDKFYRKALQTPLLYIDDAYTGIIAHAIGIVPMHYGMFLGENMVSKDLCTLSKFITSHPHKAEGMSSLYNKVLSLSSIDPNVVCWDKIFSWIHPNDIVYF